MPAWAPLTPDARAAMFARISASRAPGQAITAFASGASAHTMLSPPAVQHALLGLLTMPGVLPLRATCADARAAVAERAWIDRGTIIRGSIAAWRRCFPRALCASVRKMSDVWQPEHRVATVKDSDFKHFQGLLELDMRRCRGITDAALENLRGIHTLNMMLCYPITDAGLAFLSGIHTLDISGCSQIMDAGLVHLRGIHTLDIAAALASLTLPLCTSTAFTRWT
jgi:hypothetical protein